MTPAWLKTAAISTAAVAAVAAAAYFAAPYVSKQIGGPPSTVSTDFTKTAYDANGNVLTGPVSVGQVINYVLTYKPPTSGSSGPVTIVDTLSPNQSYVNGSLQAAGWSWVPAAPYSVGNQTTYSNPGLGPGTGFVMTVPPPSSGSGSASGITGDGFMPIPVVASGNVYSIFHHKPDAGGSASIMCWTLANLTQCPGIFPKLLSPQVIFTSQWPRAAVIGSKIYFASAQEQSNNTTADVGIGCWDTSTETPCPFIMLPGAPTLTPWPPTEYGGHLTYYVAGLAADAANPAHLIVNVKQQLYCMDVSTSLPCSGWTASPPLDPGATTTSSAYRDLIPEDGTGASRVFVQYNGDTTSPRVACRTMATGANCPGWTLMGGSSEVALPAPVSGSTYWAWHRCWILRGFLSASAPIPTTRDPRNA